MFKYLAEADGMRAGRTAVQDDKQLSNTINKLKVAIAS